MKLLWLTDHPWGHDSFVTNSSDRIARFNSSISASLVVSCVLSPVPSLLSISSLSFSRKDLFGRKKKFLNCVTREWQDIPEQSLRDVFNDVSKYIRNISISLNAVLPKLPDNHDRAHSLQVFVLVLILWTCIGYHYICARVTYWSVTSDILLNSRMTNSPTVSDVVILIVNPSGLLFHILSSVIVSLGTTVSYLLSSVDVMGSFISSSIVAFSRVCSTQRLNISGNSSPRSVQIMWRLFSPLIQMNLEDGSRANSVWSTCHHWWCECMYCGECLTRVLGMT